MNKRIVTFLILGTTFILSASTPAIAATTDISNSPYKTAIMYAEEKGIVEGYTDNTFRPAALVNRAELVKILMSSQFPKDAPGRCMEEIPAGNTVIFSDVYRDDWYAPYVCLAQRNGIVKGYPDNTFRAGEDITVVEAAKLITLSLGQKVEEDSEKWYRPYLMKLEYLRALPKTLKYITAPVTREDVVEIIWRIREKMTGEYSISANTLIRNQLLKDQGTL